MGFAARVSGFLFVGFQPVWHVHLGEASRLSQGFGLGFRGFGFRGLGFRGLWCMGLGA